MSEDFTPIDPKTVEVGLAPLLLDDTSRRKAYRLRKSAYREKKDHPADEAEVVASGWEVVRRSKRLVVSRRRKPVGDHLEDRFWSLCHDMGYPVLNGDRFNITFTREDGSGGKKQIDVFAKDSETVIVAECKAKEVRGRRTLQKDLHETAALQKCIANAIRDHFGADFNPKILWLYVTQNIIWSEPDIERAAAFNIRIITENELQYFEAYIGHVGTAGKYQFLAEFLQGQDISGLSNKKVPAVKGRFGADVFYSFTITAGHLLKLAFVNHHALNHPEGRPAYQRMVDKRRLRGIGEFIKGGGYFPTNILVNFTNACVFEPLSKTDNTVDGIKFGHLTLPSKFKSAWIIDGQHRLFGFTNLEDSYLDRPLFVVAFEKMDVAREADLFITINHKQKSVPKDLLVALQADLQMGSDDPDEALGALASFLIRKIAADATSPLFGRLEMPGVPASDEQVLTIPELQKGIRRSGLIGRIVKKARLAGYLSGPTDDATIERARKTINGYFAIVESAVPAKWLAGRAAHVATNPSVRAHLTLMYEGLRYLHGRDKIDPYTASPSELVSALSVFVDPIAAWLKKASDEEIAEKFARKYGEGGVKEYFFGLCDIVAAQFPDFGSEEYRQYKSRSSDERIAQAKLDVSDMTSLISTVVIESLKRLYGTDETPSGEKKYWELGITDSTIKESAYKKQQQAKAEKRAPREAYLDIVDFEKIIKQKGNWETLKPVFSIPLRGVSLKSKEYHLDWVKEFNDIRNVAAHSSIYRQLTDDDYDFLSWLKAELYDRCAQSGFAP